MEYIGIRYGHSVFGIFHGTFVGTFFPFWYVVTRKIWQPWLLQANALKYEVAIAVCSSVDYQRRECTNVNKN
jgi:hypothetical protein